MSQTPYEKARAVFNAYAYMDTGELPADSMSQLQVKACRWQRRNFPLSGHIENTLGVVEEIGELTEEVEHIVGRMFGLMRAAGRLTHAVLKNQQGIRGLTDVEKYRVAASDALADIMVFTMQLCTTLCVDFGTLFVETLEQIVLKRDWTANAKTGVQEPKSVPNPDERTWGCTHCGGQAHTASYCPGLVEAKVPKKEPDCPTIDELPCPWCTRSIDVEIVGESHDGKLTEVETVGHDCIGWVNMRRRFRVPRFVAQDLDEHP